MAATLFYYMLPVRFATAGRVRGLKAEPDLYILEAYDCRGLLGSIDWAEGALHRGAAPKRFHFGARVCPALAISIVWGK